MATGSAPPVRPRYTNPPENGAPPVPMVKRTVSCCHSYIIWVCSSSVSSPAVEDQKVNKQEKIVHTKANFATQKQIKELVLCIPEWCR